MQAIRSQGSEHPAVAPPRVKACSRSGAVSRRGRPGQPADKLCLGRTIFDKNMTKLQILLR